MMENIEVVTDFLWGPWTPYVLLFAGVLFTVWTRFTQYKAMTHGVQVIRGVYDDPDDPGAINHFQALAAALSATVGLGNIGGVALAIGVGGPGALFWMWIVGFLGMALKAVEITLAMMYRDTSDPENPHGGAMWVVDKVIGGKGGNWVPIARAIGTFFCITLIISAFTGGNMFQSWNVANLTHDYFGVPHVGTGIALALLVGAVIIGGIKRIGTVAAKLVPFMCLLYLACGLAVIAIHVADVPAMLALVVKSAFSPVEAGGAFIGGTMGFAFMQGMKRALFSNEAGQGSAPIAHAAAKTSEPAREGVVGGIGPFIDTICICTLTALVILTTGTWNRDAIGDLGQPLELVELVATEDEDLAATEDEDEDGERKREWQVSADVSISALPQSRWGEWKKNTGFYLLANVPGAVHQDTGNSRVKLKGKVVEKKVEGRSEEAPAVLTIQWEPVELDLGEWSGDVSTVALTDLGVHRDYGGAVLTGHAFDRAFPGLGKWLVTLAAWLFAISTMISWSYYGEQGMVYMLGERSVLPYKFVYLLLVVYASNWIGDASDMIVLMDLGTGAMLWANIPIVLGLGYLAVRCMRSYDDDLRAGKFPRNDGK